MHISKGDAFNKLLPLLVGSVFHVTNEHNWSNILTNRKLLIIPPRKQHLPTFGSNSYFQRQNCICLFDYRHFYEAKPQEHFHKCLPTLPLTENNPICILFLNQQHYDKLIPWTLWCENGIGTNVVPYVETGLRGDTPLSFFNEVLIVTVTEDKNGLAYQLKAARDHKRA
jgi:hypothetical protein